MKKLIRIYLSLVIALSPIIFINQANATVVGGWTLGNNPVAEGASAIYTGTKKVLINGAEVVKTGTAKITPAAGHVARVLARGGAAAALSVAVEQLLGAVDWVLDPANNQIVYYVKGETSNCLYLSYIVSAGKDYAVCGLNAAAQKAIPYIQSKDTIYNNYTLNYCTRTNTTDSTNAAYYAGTCTYSRTKISTGVVSTTGYSVSSTLNPDYSQEDNRRKLPLDTVAGKVIQNANAGDVSAQVATMAAAADIVKDAEADPAKAPPIVQQLENSAVTPTDETATGTQTKNPTNPDVTNLSLEFPAFCGWAPTVCEAAQTVISFPTTLQSWADAVALAWANFWEEPNLEKDTTTVDVEEKEIQDPSQFDQMYVQFGGQCPSFEATTISVGPISVPLSFDLSPLCDFALFVRPAVLGIAYLGAMGIVTAAIREV